MSEKKDNSKKEEAHKSKKGDIPQAKSDKDTPNRFAKKDEGRTFIFDADDFKIKPD